MTTKEKLFFSIMDGMNASEQFIVGKEEAIDGDTIKEGYVGRDYAGSWVYYRLDESFIEENRANFEALASWKIAVNTASISFWAKFFGILTMLGIASGIIYAIYLFSLA